MSDILGFLFVAAVIVFAVYKTFPSDSPLKKGAVVIVGALAPFWDKIMTALGLG
jgi:hypothetical protein